MSKQNNSGGRASMSLSSLSGPEDIPGVQARCPD